MLSAIAARKAAQAAKLTTQSQLLPHTSNSTAISEHGSGSESERLETVLRPQKSKRKSTEAASSETSTTRKKRRKRTVKVEASHSRYYEPSNGNADTSERVGSSLSSASDSDDEAIREVHFVDGGAEDVILSQQPRRPERAWSPSNPPPDSSDDELDNSIAGLSLPPFPTAERPASISHSSWTQDTGYQGIQSLSFIPHPEENVFYLNGLDPSFLSGRKGTVVILAENETIALLGVYSLTVLRGTVSLMGADIHASESNSHTIFAPKCSPIPFIKAMPSGKPSSSPPIPDNRIARAVSPNSAVLVLEDISTGVEGLGQVCKIFEGSFEAASLGESVLNLTGAKLLPSITRSLQTFQIPASWRTAFASLPPLSSVENDDEDDMEIPQPLTLLVRGQKRTGKSTLARTLVNRLLSKYRRVAFLECDVGQTEFTPPGLVSLHVVDRPIFGPPFTHPLLPYASHFIGASSPRNDPAHYLSAVSALLQTYKLELQYPAQEDELYESDTDDRRITDVVPLVINTMGWMKGLGADLAKQIEEEVAPTHIFSTQSPGSSANGTFPTEAVTTTVGVPSGSRTTPKTFEVEAIIPGTQFARYSAGDWRAISLMSYFHSVPSPAQYELLPAHIRPPGPVSRDSRAPLCTWDCRLPLVAQAPFSVSPADAFDNIILIGAGTEDVVPTEIHRVLNGALVALISCQPDSFEPPFHETQVSNLPYVQGASPPDPSTSNCIGLALIRAVSPSLSDTSFQSDQTRTENDVLHLLTPLPPALIAASAALCLVKGEIELPVWGMLDYRELERDGVRAREIDSVPYLQWSKSDAIGAERRRVRRNLMRKGQM